MRIIIVLVFVPSFFLSCLRLVLCAYILGVLFGFAFIGRVILVIKPLVTHPEVGYFINLITLQSLGRSYQVANPGQFSHRIQVVESQVCWH